MADNKNVLIFGELNEGKLSSVTAQLMRAGKELSTSTGGECQLLVIGGESLSGAEEGFGYGADKVFTISDAALENYVTEAYLQAMEQAINELSPGMVIFGQNDAGLDLTPRLAFRMNVGVTTDCVELKVNADSQLEQVKPVFGGKAQGHYSCTKKGPQIATVREGAYDPADFDASGSGDPTPLSVNIDQATVKTRFVKKEKDETLALALKLASAGFVASGGRGLKSKDGIDILQETADMLDGALAGSRPAIDSGWLPSSVQIGLTGKKVNPLVYMAVGISGALQHMAGCSKSKTIVAVNSDEGAPIFKLSHYGVVGDYKEVMAGFNDELKKLKG